MKKRWIVISLLTLVLLLLSASLALASPPGNGATVLNPGRGQGGGFCWYGSLTTNQVAAVRTPNGGGSLSCHFDGLAPIAETQISKGFTCSLSLNGYSLTNDTIFVRTPSGKAQMTCQFH